MPEDLERRLRAEAMTNWPNDKKRQDKYVYGGMRALGWTPKREQAGKALQSRDETREVAKNLRDEAKKRPEGEHKSQLNKLADRYDKVADKRQEEAKKALEEA